MKERWLSDMHHLMRMLEQWGEIIILNESVSRSHLCREKKTPFLINVGHLVTLENGRVELEHYYQYFRKEL